MTKPVACYLRVSTDDQSHAGQRLEVERWLAREGIDPDRVEWYEDTESGAVSSRQAFDRLRADVAKGRRKTVVVYALDRLSRGGVVEGIRLLGDFLGRGVRLASATEPIDLSGEMGLALAGVLFALAAMERKKMLERQRLGIEVARGQGVYRGRKPGAVKAKGGPARAAELRAKGLKLAEIAAALGVSERTAARYVGLGQAG